MELKAFKEKNKKKIGIIVFTVTCILLISGVILYRTFAIFETNDNFNVINGNVQDMGDVQFVFYINDEISKKAPDKNSNYSLDTTKSHCTNGAMIYWNDTTGRAEVENLSDTKTKCYLYFKEIYKEGILNGAIPDLGNGRLIPITISANEKPSDVTYNGGSAGGKVYKADITKEWYSYTKKQWANAVILKDKTKHYAVGEEIPESNIESYFVWIPRYRYQIWNGETDSYTGIKEDLGTTTDITKEPKVNQQKEIQIIFEDKNKETPSSGSTLNSWLTHPAFTAFNSNGIWVGKFETGYNQNSNLNSEITDTTTWSTSGAAKNENNSEKVIIKPNIYSWRYIQVGNAFYTSYNYRRELESHMMKNMEWGAVAYLTNSKYGRCNGTCTEVRINNNGNFVTGYSANNIPICGLACYSENEKVSLNQDGSYGYSYFNSSSQNASTTGNYYGIYDMSGGAWEQVMGVMQGSDTDPRPSSGTNETDHSGFKGPYSNIEGEKTDGLEWPSSKYYDLYDFGTSNTTYQRGHLGDATKEGGPFYKILYKQGNNNDRKVGSFTADIGYFVYSLGGPWFLRGDGYENGTDTGIFSFYHIAGSVDNNITFRIVLSPF